MPGRRTAGWITSDSDANRETQGGMVWLRNRARELVRNACCDVISVYPGKNAGIAKSRAIAELAGQAGLSATGHRLDACPSF